MDSIAREALNYAVTLHTSGKVARALSVYSEINGKYPYSIELYLNIGSALHDLECYREAITVYDMALENNPAWWQVLNNKGNSLFALDRFRDAIECYEKCWHYNKDNAECLVAMGTSLESLRLYDEALVVYDSAILCNQHCAEAHWNRGLALLRRGAWNEGWSEYEWRWLKKGYTERHARRGHEKWDGRTLQGETVLIHAEQAYGDTLQFVRYVPLVAEAGGKVVLECPLQLVELLSTVRGVWRVIPSGTECSARYAVPLLSLPMIFGTTIDTVPLNVPYFGSSHETKDYWLNHVKKDTGLKVGLVWAGRKTPDPHRTCGLRVLAPLWGIKGVTYYSLQLDEVEKVEREPEIATRLVDFTGMITNFADTAALIECLDLVITIDTAVAHLAGGLGKLTYIMVPFAPDWRWMLGRSDSPWYPTMRIFRQKDPYVWGDVVKEISLEIANLAGEKNCQKNPAQGFFDSFYTNHQ
jgi:tetratricopeptide (TPR) repeat protein